MDTQEKNAINRDAKNFQHLIYRNGFGIMDDRFSSHLKCILAMESAYWKLIKKGYKGKTVRLWYRSDACVEDYDGGTVNGRKSVRDIESGKRQHCQVTLSSSLNDDIERKELMYPDIVLYSRNKMIYCTKGIFGDVTLLKNVHPIAGINRCMLYIGTAFTYFLYDVEDADHASVSYSSEGVSNAWYVIAPICRSDYEDIIAEYVYAPRFVNEFKRGTRHIAAMKTTIFDLVLLINEDASFKAARN